MKRSILSALAVPVYSLALVVMAAPFSAQAKELQKPHLIQTVTEKDIYEGLLALDLLEAPTLHAENCDLAFENVKDCVVRINMGNAYGSGVIWEMTPDYIVIATNKHVLEYWDDFLSYVYFPQGYFINAEILGVSEKYDVGFLEIDNLQFDYAELEQMRYVNKDLLLYQSLQAGETMFCIGTEGDGAADSAEGFYQGSIGDTWLYIDEFREYMIYCYGYAKPGMSGGGTFDARGNFIGMLTGGTTNNETASVPLPIIIEAYEEIIMNKNGDLYEKNRSK